MICPCCKEDKSETFVKTIPVAGFIPHAKETTTVKYEQWFCLQCYESLTQGNLNANR